MRRRHHRKNGGCLTALLFAALMISIMIASHCSNNNGINEATHEVPPIEPNKLNLHTNRQLSIFNIASNFDDPKSIAYKPADSDSDEQSLAFADAKAVVQPEEIKIDTYTDLINNAAPLPKYSLKNVIEAANMYTSRYALLRYDPATDRFVAYYSNKHNWVSGCSKLAEAVRILTIILRNTLAERLTPDSGELILAVSGGDYPAIDSHKYGVCLHKNEEKPCDESLLYEAPILHFGSVFSQPLFPNIIGMPMPRSHTDCFLNWLVSDKMPCQLFAPNQSDETLSWDDLIPQLVWRGTDFRFLSIQNDLKRPDFNRHINGKTNPKTNQMRAAAGILRDQYYRWLPRWKGVLYTAESEIEASRTKSLPKINIKFSDVAEGGKHAAIGAKEYKEWEKIGFPVAGEHMDESHLSKYKYHIDLGGGGGTTWTGFVRKLGMPGLLFHHVTATKDYIHDQTQPWVHYVPVQSNLSDLMEKLEWAETHQDEARLISERATALMKHISTSVGFEQIFDQHMLNPLIGVIDAYESMNLGDDKAFYDAFGQLGGEDFYQFMECTREKGCVIGKPTLSWYKGS